MLALPSLPLNSALIFFHILFTMYLWMPMSAPWVVRLTRAYFTRLLKWEWLETPGTFSLSLERKCEASLLLLFLTQGHVLCWVLLRTTYYCKWNLPWGKDRWLWMAEHRENVGLEYVPEALSQPHLKPTLLIWVSAYVHELAKFFRLNCPVCSCSWKHVNNISLSICNTEPSYVNKNIFKLA